MINLVYLILKYITLIKVYHIKQEKAIAFTLWLNLKVFEKKRRAVKVLIFFYGGFNHFNNYIIY